MPSICAMCSSAVTRHKAVVCDGRCGELFHFNCAGVPQEFLNLAGKPGILWKCTACRSASTSTSDDSLLTTLTEIKSDIALLKRDQQELLQLQKEISVLKQEQIEFKHSVEHFSSQFDEFTTSIQSFKTALSKINGLEAKVAALHNENSGLRTQLNDLQQYTRKNNVEISGVPEQKNEQIKDIIMKIGEVVGCTIADSDMDVCHRVAHMNNGNKNSKSIIVRFQSRNKKQDFLSASKRYRNLNSSELGFVGNVCGVYVNEHLTLENKKLFKSAREFSRENNFKYCWVRDCRIYVKRSDESRAIVVQDESVLSRLRGGLSL